MFGTHAIARSLTDANLTAEQADAITAAITSAAEHGDHVTRADLQESVSTLRAGHGLDGVAVDVASRRHHDRYRRHSPLHRLTGRLYGETEDSGADDAIGQRLELRGLLSVGTTIVSAG